LNTDRGTPCTWYLPAKCGNSIASTMSARTCSDSIANW
jgi:hypothetical protein